MDALGRRSFLLAAGATAAFSAHPWLRAPRPRARRPDPEAVRALAARIVRTPRERIFELADEAVADGADWELLLAAVFLAGVHEVSPRPPGTKHHCVLVVESIFQLAEQSAPADRILPVLYDLDDVKASQARDDELGDWDLLPVDTPRIESPDAARRALVEAMERGDASAAEAHVLGLLPHVDADELFEILWPFALRDFLNIGHKAIHAAHTHRTLRRIGWEHASGALRSLVFGLTMPTTAASNDSAFEESRRRAARLRADWLEGDTEPQRSLELARALRDLDQEAAIETVFDAVQGGLAASAAWDALRLFGAEVFGRAPSLLPVHLTTVPNAHAYIYRTTRNETTRRLALLQTASFQMLARNAVYRRQTPREGDGLRGLLEMPDTAPPRIERVLADGRPSPRDLCHALHRPEAFDALGSEMRAQLYRAPSQPHEHKFAAAVLEELHHAHARWRPVLAATVFGYLPTRASGAWEHEERIRRIAARGRR